MIKVGCCGFPTSMSQYFKNFNIVELNRTFYQYPRALLPVIEHNTSMGRPIVRNPRSKARKTSKDSLELLKILFAFSLILSCKISIYLFVPVETFRHMKAIHAFHSQQGIYMLEHSLFSLSEQQNPFPLVFLEPS